MFVRMAHWQCKAELREEAEALFDSGALPILARQPGIVAAQLLGEPDTGDRVALTLWESRAAHDAFCASGDLEEITRMFAPMYVEGARPRADLFPVLRGRRF